ncbi:DUF2750 domain-containing protein [Marinobacter adhaerens]|uniref:DUF2750 domain-containing protein n=1 Tax=Marinobacter adhaerens TaxID=1033846 RepID=A0A851HUE1_9GAMM|nr:DUF2750 domain-containing protein [Marinobacter adhaerens]NWN91166.1 DUF2750 domain-containing protein [Marinobacter adhaerens]
MSNEQLTSVLEMSGEERYDYFLSQVLEDREVWILINSENRFLSIVSDDDGLAHLPVWPSSEFAVEYAKGSDDLTPKSLSLPDFFRKWVPGLSKDGLQVGVFPGTDQTLWITEADELKKDLQAELSSF